MPKLAGKVAIVTGASKGIGAADKPPLGGPGKMLEHFQAVRNR